MIRILISISFFIFFDSFSQSDKEIENKTIETIQRNWDTFFSMLSIPNDAYYTDDISKNIKWCEEKFSELGFKVEKVKAESTNPDIPNHPLIIAHKNISQDFKTVLIYFHMDGQPIDPSKWNQDNPYIPILSQNINGKWTEIERDKIYDNPDREWRIFGRSTSDDKGPPMMLINALETLNKLKIKPKFNIKLIIDFQEEEEHANSRDLDVEIIGYIISNDNISEYLTNIEVGLKLFEKIFKISDLKKREVFSDTWEKQKFPPISLGKDIVIVPKEKDKINFLHKKTLVIEPSMAFGTGHHVTTKMCIELLEDFIEGEESVIDFGTGTGILALCSLLLGAKSVFCVDNDIESIYSSKKNFEKSGFISKAEFFHGDLSTIPEKNKKFDIVLANLTSHILIENFEHIFRKVDQNGFIIMSGILETRINEVIETFLNKKLKLLKRLQYDNWVSLVFQRI